LEDNYKNELISVILPVYNGEKYLKESIESILNQTYTNFEFIIINDGSKDSSLEIIREYEKEDERIVVVSRENKGLIATLNEGIEKAKGKYIARMDQDDISLPERFERQIKVIKNNNIMVCGTYTKIIDEDGKYIKDGIVPTQHDEIVKKLLECTNPLFHPTVMFKKFDNIFYNELAHNCEDYELWLKYTEIGKIENLPEYLLKYRIELNSITNSGRYLSFYNISNLFCEYVKMKLSNKMITKEKLIFQPKYSMTILQNLTSRLYSKGVILGYENKKLKSIIYKGLAVLISPNILWIYLKRIFMSKQMKELK
jgi:glycosyltransferase involved in cell wall biosynthesis